MAALAHNEPVLISNPGEYHLSADLASGQTVRFDRRYGESGAWQPITLGDTPVEIDSADSAATVAVAAGTYLRAVANPDTIVARAEPIF